MTHNAPSSSTPPRQTAVESAKGLTELLQMGLVDDQSEATALGLLGATAALLDVADAVREVAIEVEIGRRRP